MNQSTDNLEDFFNQSFNDDEKVNNAAEWNLPSEPVWEKIQDGLTEERRLNVLFFKWPWSAIAASYLLMVGGYQFFQSYIEVPISNTSIVFEEPIRNGLSMDTDIACADEFNQYISNGEKVNLSVQPTPKYLAEITTINFNNEIIITNKNVDNQLVIKGFENNSIPEKWLLDPLDLHSFKNLKILNPKPINLPNITPAIKKASNVYVAANYGFINEDLKKNNFSRENQDFFAAKETHATGNSVGIQIGLENKKGWAIETGIHYTKIAKDLMVNQSITPQDLPQDLITNGEGDLKMGWHSSTGYNEQMLTLRNNSTTPIAVVEPLNIDIIQKTQKEYVDIPLVLKKRWVSGKLGLSVKSGILNRFEIDNSLEASTIKLADAELEVLASEFKQNTTAIKNNKYVPHVVAGIGVEYFIQPNLSVYIEPTFTKSLRPVIDFGFANVTAQNSMVNLGVRYEL